MVAWLAGWAAGTAGQWQQAALWPVSNYGALVLLAGVAGGGWWLTRRRAGRRLSVLRWTAAALCAALLGCASTGWRATAQQAQVLAPVWEARDLWLTGTVADLPQAHADGQTVVVAVLAAQADGQTATLPRRVRLFWPDAPAGVLAGQVWRWPVRLRAPHGLFNAHGFDRELWFWEQAIGATGVVRVGRQVAAPVALGQSPRHAIDRWRGQLTEAVRTRIADPRPAGIVAALLVGHQSAITRGH